MENKVSMQDPNPEDAKAQLAKKGLKLNPGRSQFTPKAQNKEEFNKKADEWNEATQNKFQRGSALVKDFWSELNNKELVKNKGPLAKSRESEILNNLVSYAIEINNDETEQKDGTGSVAIISLLLKAVIYQRDLYNELEYRLAEFEKEVKKSSDAVGK